MDSNSSASGIPPQPNYTRQATATAPMSVAPGSGQDASVEDYIQRLHPDATNIQFNSAEQGFGAKGVYTYTMPNGGVGYTDPDVLQYQRNGGAHIAGRDFTSDGFMGGDGTGGGGTGSGSGTGGAAGDVATTEAQKNAGAYLTDLLGQYGLSSLSDFAWKEIVNGRTSAEVLNDIRQTQQFKDRFPAIAQREQYNLTHPGANLPPLSPGEYVSYEKSYQQTLRNAGLPQGFMDDPSTVTKLLANDVSIAEMTQRIDQARVATYEMNPEALSRLQQMHGIGPGSGALTALMLDPTQAEPLLKRDLLAAQIGGQADRTGYLGLNNTTAQVMAQNGVSEQQAQSGFTNLQHDQPLFGALPGTQESNISQSAQLAAQFAGNAEDQRLIDARRSQRISQFADGGAGGFAGSANGLSGLGSAPR